MKWQPIGTAPKDGTELLFFCGDGCVVGRWSNKKRGPGASGCVQEPGWVATSNGDEIDDEGWDTGHGFTMEIEPDLWAPISHPQTEE